MHNICVDTIKIIKYLKFSYFIIFVVSTYYILCISWIIECIIIIDARSKHEDYIGSTFIK